MLAGSLVRQRLVSQINSSPSLANYANLSVSSLTYAASNVAQGVYYLRVRAVNSAGTSAPSNEVILIIGNGCVSAPTAPSNLRASVNASTVVVTWTASGNNPTNYRIEAGSSAGAANLTAFDLGSADTVLTAFAVARGAYYVRVRGKNACGAGPASNEIVVSVP